MNAKKKALDKTKYNSGEKGDTRPFSPWVKSQMHLTKKVRFGDPKGS